MGLSQTTQKRPVALAFIGTSGYAYPSWGEGAFYPPGLREKGWLEYYATRFSTVELNITFYRLPRESVFTGWHRRTPKAFTFAVKGSRFITHVKRLEDPAEPLKFFFERAGIFKEKLGAVLWQLPPRFHYNRKTFLAFLTALGRYEARNAFEVRDKTWLTEEVFDALRDHGMVLCHHDWPGLPVTSPDDFPFLYIRRHGPTSLYHGSYSSRQLKGDAKKVSRWMTEGKNVFVYFNNTSTVDAVRNALGLRKLIADTD